MTPQADIFFNGARRFTELALHPAGGDNSKIEVAIFEKRSVKIKKKVKSFAGLAINLFGIKTCP
ncbi:MAG: hypothetical protein DMF25_03040 [Verrucomicrobia bacterium]|nr:MAG: hypothetical protein DMF25_03040 [Verrucomicrobiota bacterium]